MSHSTNGSTRPPDPPCVKCAGPAPVTCYYAAYRFDLCVPDAREAAARGAAVVAARGSDIPDDLRQQLERWQHYPFTPGPPQMTRDQTVTALFNKPARPQA